MVTRCTTISCGIAYSFEDKLVFVGTSPVLRQLQLPPQVLGAVHSPAKASLPALQHRA